MTAKVSKDATAVSISALDAIKKDKKFF